MNLPQSNLSTLLKLSFKDRKFLNSYLKNIFKLIKYNIKVAFSKKYKKVCIITLTEHMGDIVACEPVSRFLKKTFPQYFLVWCINYKYMQLVEYNSSINRVLSVTCLSEWIFLKKFIKKFNIVYDLHFHDRICNKYLLKNNNPNSSGINAENYYHYGNLLDVLPRLAGLYNLPDVSPQFYFPKEEKGNSIVEYKNYIVIHAESNEQDRNWDAEKWNIVCEKLLGSYPLATIIEIGFKQQVTINNNRYISLCNKLTLLQNAIIIKNAVLFIGIDSGFAHFANALNTKSIILLGEYRDFKTYMPYSGEFKNGNNATIFNYPGILRKLDVETVEKLINDKMESFFKSGKNYINGSANNTSLEIINYNYFS